MAKLVLGNTKTNVTPAIVRDVAPAHYIEKSVDANGKLINSSTFIDLTGITDIGSYALAYAYYGTDISDTNINMNSITGVSGSSGCAYAFHGCANITNVNFLQSLTTVTGNTGVGHMFHSCSYLTSASLPALTTIDATSATAYMFAFCSRLTSFSAPKLTTIGGYGAMTSMFSDCTALETLDLSSITTVLISASSAFGSLCLNCNSLRSVNFNGLTVLQTDLGSSSRVFSNCRLLENVTFGGLKASTFSTKLSQLNNIFSSSTGQNATNGCTIHFPSNFDPSDPNHTFDASTLTGYPTFGGNASYIHVAFDLPATE